MGRIPEETVEEVRQRADIVAVIGGYVTIQRRGRDHWCCCPFHKEKTPSFKIGAEYGTYHCFGCGESGNVYKFIMMMENVDFPAAVRLLARQVGVHIPEELPATAPDGRPADREITKDSVFEMLGKAADWFRQRLAGPEGEKARSYLAGRGLDRSTIAGFGIGYAPDSWDGLMQWGMRQGFSPKLMIAAGLLTEREEEGGGGRVYDRFRGRIMFPIWDELGRVAGFSGRVMEADAKSAKYVNTPETMTFHKGRLLYGLNIARKSFRDAGCALICEGQLDVIACHRAGLTHAVAPQGTAFTEEQAKLLRRHTEEVVFAFDADAAGLKAAVRSLEVAMQADLRVKVVSMPEGEDPDGIYRKGGAEPLRAVMGQGREAFDFLFATVSARVDLNSPRGKETAVSELLEVISRLPHPVTRAGLCQWLAGKADIPEQAIFETLNQILRKRRRTDSFKTRGQQPGEPAPPPEPPPFADPRNLYLNSKILGALENLFDLALRHETIAYQLVNNEHLTADCLGRSNVERALLLLLQKTAEDDWANAGKAIGADHILSSDPALMRLMNHSRHPVLDEDESTSEQLKRRHQERVAAAVTDCLHVIEKHHLEEQERQLKNALKKSGPEDTVTLLTDLQKLMQRKQTLQPGNRKP